MDSHRLQCSCFKKFFELIKEQDKEKGNTKISDMVPEFGIKQSELFNSNFGSCWLLRHQHAYYVSVLVVRFVDINHAELGWYRRCFSKANACLVRSVPEFFWHVFLLPLASGWSEPLSHFLILPLIHSCLPNETTQTNKFLLCIRIRCVGYLVSRKQTNGNPFAR
jgi:hypothetical protein